ncbi:MAG: hypothetical protein PHS48_04250 [Bacteroidales bacterium]|nr:hypothetical protein [Bacteroidales bacterium]
MNTRIISVGILLLGTLFSAPFTLQGQGSRTPITVNGSVDLVSRYIWRGLEIGQAPSIQPDLSISRGAFTLGSWGAYRMSGPGILETDFYISGEFGFITVALWDYWTFEEGRELNFFTFHEPSTSHLLEVQVTTSGGDRLPFNLLGSYFFYGADPTRSLYLELQFDHQVRETSILAFAGAQAKGTYYGPKPGLVNVGCRVSRPIRITEHFSLPLSLSVIVNPLIGSTYLVAGCSFSFSGDRSDSLSSPQSTTMMKNRLFDTESPRR